MKKCRAIVECFCVFLSTILCIFCFPLNVFATSIDFSSSPDYHVLDNLQDIENYIKNKYSEYSNVSYSLKVQHMPLATNNYQQSTFVSDYPFFRSGTISGACSETAVTIMNEFMIRSGKVSSSPTPQALSYEDPEWGHIDCGIEMDLFLRATDAAFANGWDGSGTSATMIDEIVTGVMAYCSPKYKGDYSIFDMHSKYMDSYYAGVPILLSLGGHTVVGVSIMEFNVTYTKKTIFNNTKKYTELETFVVVNDGWSYDTNSYDVNSFDILNSEYVKMVKRKYSYVPYGDIKAIIVPER